MVLSSNGDIPAQAELIVMKNQRLQIQMKEGLASRLMILQSFKPCIPVSLPLIFIISSH